MLNTSLMPAAHAFLMYVFATVFIFFAIIESILASIVIVEEEVIECTQTLVNLE